VAASREALRLADLRYRSGVSSYLEILDVQRQVLAAETVFESATLGRKLARVQFYRAQGGGWVEHQQCAAVPPGQSSAAVNDIKRRLADR
jgi:multidrug efflux system outer membrane protein